MPYPKPDSSLKRGVFTGTSPHLLYLTEEVLPGIWSGMNQKTAKLLKKYAEAKGISDKQIKREWLVLNETQKDQKRQEILKELVKK